MAIKVLMWTCYAIYLVKKNNVVFTSIAKIKTKDIKSLVV